MPILSRDEIADRVFDMADQAEISCQVTFADCGRFWVSPSLNPDAVHAGHLDDASPASVEEMVGAMVAEVRREAAKEAGRKRSRRLAAADVLVSALGPFRGN